MKARTDETLEFVGHGGVDLDAHHRAEAALLQRQLELPDEVFGLFFDFHVRVADQAEHTLGLNLAAGEQMVEEEADQRLERHEAALGLAATGPLRRQLPEARDLGRDRHQRVEHPSVGQPAQLQHQRKRQVRDERERVGRVDGQWGEHREELGGEGLFQRIQLGVGDLGGGNDVQPFGGQFVAELAPAGLLVAHQVGSLVVDALQLLGRGQAVLAGDPHAFAHLGAQAGHADHVEFVQVVGADRQEAQPLQQRVAGVHALRQHPAVEGQPGELAVEEPRRRGGQLLVPGEWPRKVARDVRGDGRGKAHSGLQADADPKPEPDV